ncbi:MAG: hypothetical protein LBH77_08560, partial [Tannerella sp.]|nr:hypothetical protein [Tannerella sp.]
MKRLTILFLFVFSAIHLAGSQNIPQTKKIVCVGASITAGGRTTNPAVNSYPAQLGKMLGDDY